MTPVTDYEIARARMVKEQVTARGITHPAVIRAMRIVPRHLFLDQAFWPRAYGDHPLPIGNNQTISQPYIVALMSQELDVQPGMKVLEIGTGSGYQAAVLSVIGCKVYTVERNKSLLNNAKNIVTRLKINNISFKHADGSIGWDEHAPFDRIIVTAGSPSVPNDLIEQLFTGGKLVIPVGDRDNQRLTVLTKGPSMLEKREVSNCSFVPLIGEKGW